MLAEHAAQIMRCLEHAILPIAIFCIEQALA